MFIQEMCLNASSAKWRPFCLGLNVLIKTMENQPDVADWLAPTRHFMYPIIMDAGWNFTQQHCVRDVYEIRTK